MIKSGDLIFWHGRNTIALVVRVEYADRPCDRWVHLLEADGFITHDPLDDGCTVIDENWDWPEWHINHKDNQ